VAANSVLAPWTGEKSQEKAIVGARGAGVGDHILFASLIPDLAKRAEADGGSVVLECDPA